MKIKENSYFSCSKNVMVGKTVKRQTDCKMLGEKVYKPVIGLKNNFYNYNIIKCEMTEQL
jgi:hypothetical protein